MSTTFKWFAQCTNPLERQLIAKPIQGDVHNAQCTTLYIDIYIYIYVLFAVSPESLIRVYIYLWI